jgi:rod shape-determining protein MreC
VLSVLALVFISLDFAGGALSGAHQGVTGALGSLYRGTDSVLGPTRRFVQGIPEVGANRRLLADLELQNARLRRALTAAQADQGTAEQLRKLQLEATAGRLRVLAARVIATGPGSGFQWTVTVDVGARENVAVGQTVTDSVSVVGRVLAVYPTTSVILLVSDPTSGVGVRDERTGQLLLASGAGAGDLNASPLDDTALVRTGDVLLTGPAGRTTYTPGLPVGTVSSVHVGADGSTRVGVRPAAALTGLDLLGVVQGTPDVTGRPALDGSTG